MLYSYFFNMLKVGVPGATQVPQLLVYNPKKQTCFRNGGRSVFIGRQASFTIVRVLFE